MDIKELKEIIESNICGDGYDADGRAENILDAAKELINSKWIPCSKRLPDTEVLCCDLYGSIMVGYVIDVKNDTLSETRYEAENDNEYMHDVIAWMPLPQPYKGE